MFTLPPSTSDIHLSPTTFSKNVNKNSWRTTTFLAATLTTLFLVTGCQQQPNPVVDEKVSQVSEEKSVEDNKIATQSDSTAARIKQIQPLYVIQMQGLQQRLQAEYEALQAADISGNDSSLLTKNEASANNATVDTATATDMKNTPTINADAEKPPTTASNEAEINTSTEIGERDLEVLKRISLEPREPIIITEAQIIERYQQALEALYQPASSGLSAQDTDTLLNIATLSPQLFEDPEIAERVSVKSPALARLIVQYQVWQQIEAQQAEDMQKMKVTQQQEFEGLMTKFNDTIKGYDEQIAKYEQTLEGFK